MSFSSLVCNTNHTAFEIYLCVSLHSFLFLNGPLLYGYTMVCLFSRWAFMFTVISEYELTNCEHSCIGFYVNISFFLDKYI